MALIKLNCTRGMTGNLPALNGSALTNLSAGKVLQVQSGYLHSDQSTSATSDTATSLEDQITPSATSSKILVMVDGGRGSYGGGTCEGVIKIYRKIGSGSYSELRVAHNDSVQEAGGYGKPTIAFTMLDSPNTTDAVDYKVYIKTNANTFYFNSSGAQVSIVLMEIGA